MVKPNEEEFFELLSDVRAGNDGAFARLVAMYDGLLRSRAAKFTQDAHEAEDAYQEACLALHSAAVHYEPKEHVTFGRFATVCVENRLKDMRRKRRAGGGLCFVPLVEEELCEFRDRMVEKEQAKELLSLIRSALSSYEYRVFRMYIIKGIPVSEIAGRLGREEKSVRNALSRLLVKLRDRLGH